MQEHRHEMRRIDLLLCAGLFASVGTLEYEAEQPEPEEFIPGESGPEVYNLEESDRVEYKLDGRLRPGYSRVRLRKSPGMSPQGGK